MNRPRASRVLLVVSGGIAAYKTPELVRALIKHGHEVQVVLTEAGSGFVTALTLSALSGRAVRHALLDPSEEGRIGHIELADWPDLVVVAPATADLMARSAHGLASDLASTVLLATRAPVLWAPAMNANMWTHPATRANLHTLHERGAMFVGPDAGELACGWVGEGRMSEPEVIAAAVTAFVRRADDARGLWAGKRVLVSAGPTRAYLDPVRFLTNASTGAMGFALAEVAAARGAEVVLVCGPVEQPTPTGVDRRDVETAEQMLAAMDGVLTEGTVDLVAMAAAVCDLAPSAQAGGKRPKREVLRSLAAGALIEGVDVLATLTRRYADRSFFLGFAAQTVRESATLDEVDAELVAAGRSKLARKGCQAMFVNRVGVEGVGFGSKTNTGVLMLGHETRRAGPPQPKSTLAGWMLDQLVAEVARAE